MVKHGNGEPAARIVPARGVNVADGDRLQPGHQLVGVHAAARLVMAVLWFTLPVRAADSAGLTLADNGQALVRIVIDPRNASPEEKRAADDLARYLGRITGAAFAVSDEREVEPGTPAVYVGSTAFADSQGIHATQLAPQETRLRTLANSLILCGGRPYGTTFGVWRLLEDYAGCRWYTVFDEVVPAQAKLALPAVYCRSPWVYTIPPGGPAAADG